MNANVPTISPQALSAHHSQGEPVTLIDVRIPAEFDSEHATGARLFPLNRFELEQGIRSFSDHGLGCSKPISVLCRSGACATQAAQKLMHRGYSNVYVIEGGTEAGAKAGL
jgi:rhodanese-related sulfurtransferase